MPNARSDGANKIDAALYQGPDQLIDAIEEDFGIPIQHFVELNFDSFINVVNALGGIKMYFPEPVYDAYSGLNIQTTGCIQLNGTQALQVVRARHVQYKGPGVTTDDPSDWPQEAQSDIARIRRDHEFLRVLATAVKAKGLSNPLTDQQLVSGVVGQLTVDSGFSASAMIDLVLDYHNVDVNTAPQLTLPVAVDQFGELHLPGRQLRGRRVPGRAAGPRRGGPVPRAQLEQRGHVLGRRAAGAVVGDRLGDERHGRVQPGDRHGVEPGSLGLQDRGRSATARRSGQEAETVVYYSSKSPAELAAAQAVANSMSGAVIMADDASQVSPGSQVTVVTGTDFSVNPPARRRQHHLDHFGPADEGSGHVGRDDHHDDHEPASARGEHRQQRAFAAPTATVEPLAPWDPRSCTASGGEGS